MTQIKHLQNFFGNAALTPAGRENPPAGGAEYRIPLISILAGQTLLQQHRSYVSVAGGDRRNTPNRSIN